MKPCTSAREWGVVKPIPEIGAAEGDIVAGGESETFLVHWDYSGQGRHDYEMVGHDYEMVAWHWQALLEVYGDALRPLAELRGVRP
jgi:hypothetical protein